MSGHASPWRKHASHVTLRIRLTPKSSHDAIEGIEQTPDGPTLKARVRAIPSQGAANRALEILCAKWLSVPKSKVALANRSKSRIKTLRITGDPNELCDRLTELTARKDGTDTLTETRKPKSGLNPLKPPGGNQNR